MVDLVVNNKRINDVELVIFDRDGTLIELYHYWAQMIQKRADLICQHYGLDIVHQNKIIFEMGVDIANRKLRPEGPVGLKKREVVMQAAIDYLASIGIDQSQATCTEIFNQVDKLSQATLAGMIRPLRGAIDLIDRLRELGCKTAMATNDKTERARLCLELLGLINKFDYIIGADAVTCAKPAPDMVDMILAGLKMNKDHVVIVGDASSDMEMGINAKVKANIGVCSGITSKSRMLELTNYVIDDVSGIYVSYGGNRGG